MNRHFLTLISVWYLLGLMCGCSVLTPLETSSLKTPELQTNKGISDIGYPVSDIGSDSAHTCPPLIWPLKDGVVTQEFKEKRGRRRGHKGVDIAAPRGDSVFAAHNGLVIFAGRKFRGFGRLVIIENDQGNWATFYSHLTKIKTKTGKRVAQGDLIGSVGRSGRATGYHLHFEVRHNKEPINPLTVLP